MKKLNVAIIGAGFGVTSHLPAFKRNKHCKVIALCSRNLKKSNFLKNKNNIKYYFNNWKKMLSEVDLDIVSIAVPPIEQTKIINICLKKSIAIFAEKPLTTNIFNSKKILDLQKKNKIPTVVDFIFPELEEWIYIKKILQKKKFGNLKNINIDLNYQSHTNLINKNSWKNNLNQGGGLLHHIVCHIFYYIEWLFESVNSISAYLYKEKKYRFSGHTNAVILLRFKSGVYATIQASNNSTGINEHIIKFFNDTGTIILENKSKDWINDFDLYTIKKKSLLKNKVFFKKKIIRKNEDSRLFPVSQIVNRLVEWILLKKKTMPNFEDGHRVQCLIDAAIKSNKLNGKWINLK